MRYDKLRKQLELLILLSDGRNYTIEELCERVGVSRRNFYYLLDFIKHAGFILFKHDGFYHIDRRSSFFTQMLQAIQFGDRDVKTIHSLLTMAGSGSEMVNQLRCKIESSYDLSISSDSLIRRQMDSNIKLLRKAMEEKKMVCLIGYSSPHSHTVKDRLVEPFLFLHNNEDVRCHELVTKENKTFKISRMKRVEILDSPWLHEDKHRQVFTDIFLFSGEERYRVKLRLGQLSHNLFKEEYPQGAHLLHPYLDDTWLLDIDVCDYRGLGRFVLGLFKDIEIMEGEGFKAYMREEIKGIMESKNLRLLNEGQ